MMAVDCHIHMVLDGVNWKQAISRHAGGVNEAYVRGVLKQYQAQGAAYLRDGGDRWGVCTLAAQLAPEYGIRYVTPGFPICRAGHYGMFIGRSFETFSDYRLLVEKLRRCGGSFVKLMISGIMDFSQLGVLTDEPMPPELLHDCVSLAHDEGLPVMVHANGDAAVSAAIRAGVDSVEHGAYLTDETLHMLAESDAVFTPTLVTIHNLIGCGRYPDAVLQPLFEQQCAAVQLAAKYGAYLAVGSDAGAFGVYHARAMHEEQALLRQLLGASAEQVLRRGVKKLTERF